MTIQFIRHPSGMVYPVEPHEDQPKEWPGIITDPSERVVVNHHFQLMYRSLKLHENGRHELRNGFNKVADWMLGKWYFESEEQC